MSKRPAPTSVSGFSLGGRGFSPCLPTFVLRIRPRLSTGRRSEIPLQRLHPWMYAPITPFNSSDPNFINLKLLRTHTYKITGGGVYIPLTTSCSCNFLPPSTSLRVRPTLHLRLQQTQRHCSLLQHRIMERPHIELRSQPLLRVRPQLADLQLP